VGLQVLVERLEYILEFFFGLRYLLCLLLVKALPDSHLNLKMGFSEPHISCSFIINIQSWKSKIAFVNIPLLDEAESLFQSNPEPVAPYWLPNGFRQLENYLVLLVGTPLVEVMAKQLILGLSLVNLHFYSGVWKLLQFFAWDQLNEDLRLI